jgi:hypothetical protein
MISVHNYEKVKETYDISLAGELVVNVSGRIQSLVRPLDVVTYFSPGLFALVLIQPNIEQCTAKCYNRILTECVSRATQRRPAFSRSQLG